MSLKPSIAFAKFAAPRKGTVFVLSAEGEKLAGAAAACDPAGTLPRAFEAAEFSGKFGAAVDVLAPQGIGLDRLVAIGAGKVSALDEHAWLRLGGTIAAALRNAAEATVVLDLPGVSAGGAEAAAVAAGILLRSYAFDKYKTRKDANGQQAQKKPAKISIQTSDPAGARKRFADTEAVIDGVLVARDLVNEPANMLGPMEVAARASALEALGVKVEVLTEKEMRKLGMGALLGVAQGSIRPPRLVVMRWDGGKPKDKPVAFVGKGVVFDTGGVSIKPAGGMEDMKGDMGGAAAVTGLMHALAARKAKANVIGVIGLVENMPDGNAQRPGDIVTSMSGQTIEVINTDAEGRLVLADALVRATEAKPDLVLDVATLTGHMVVALGDKLAGVMGSDDVVERVLAASRVAGEECWPMPIPEHMRERITGSKVAALAQHDWIRWGGGLFAAAFLREFTAGLPWAHLDIAGPAFNSGGPSGHLTSGGTGFAVATLVDFARELVGA